MANFKLKVNEQALKRTIENSPGFKKIQDRVNAQVNEAIQQVAAEMAGKPEPEIVEALKARIAAKVPGATWNGAGLQKIAAKISSASPDD